MTLPQSPAVVHPAGQVRLSYEPLSSGNVTLSAGAAPSTSTVRESALEAGDGSVTPFVAVTVFAPCAAGEEKP